MKTVFAAALLVLLAMPAHGGIFHRSSVVRSKSMVRATGASQCQMVRGVMRCR
jgi:hypothetical protein